MTRTEVNIYLFNVNAVRFGLRPFRLFFDTRSFSLRSSMFTRGSVGTVPSRFKIVYRSAALEINSKLMVPSIATADVNILPDCVINRFSRLGFIFTVLNRISLSHRLLSERDDPTRSRCCERWQQ